MKKTIFKIRFAFIALIFICSQLNARNEKPSRSSISVLKNTAVANSISTDSLDPNFSKIAKIRGWCDPNGRILNPQICKDIKEVKIINEGLSTIKLDDFTNVRFIELSRNNLSKLDLSKSKNITELILSGNNFGDTAIHYIDSLNNLTYLNLSNNKLTMTPIEKDNKSIKILILSDNSIDSLDLKNYKVLEEFYCSQCNLKKLDITHNSNLKILDVANGNDKLVINGLSNSVKLILAKKETFLSKMFQSVKDGNYDEQDKMGMITFKTNRKLKVYYNDTQITDINIDKVKLSIMEGVIADVKIYPSESSGYDGFFTNCCTPIPFSDERFHTDMIYFYGHRTNGEKNKHFVYLSDILNLDKNRYMPDNDDDIILDSEHRNYELVKNIGVNNIIDARIYTDGVALFGGNQNGIVQTSINYRHIIHSTNAGNDFPYWFFLRNLNVYATYTKFDSAQQYARLSDSNRLELFQKQYFTLGFNISLIDGILKKSSNFWNLSLGFEGGPTKVIKDSATIVNPFTPTVYGEFGLRFFAYKKFGINMNARVIFQFAPGKEYNYFGEYPHDNRQTFYRLSGEIFWSPFKADVINNSRLFLRGNYFGVFTNIYKNEHFYQAQIGYSFNLSANKLSK